MQNIRIYLKDLGADNWTDVTARCTNVKPTVRKGFGSLGSTSDVSKLTLEYKADDLATAVLFHSGAKQVKVEKDGTTLFEGYTEGDASVESTALLSLAWVSISAYPYAKKFEDVIAPSDLVFEGKKICDPSDKTNSLLHLLVDALYENLDEPYKTICGAIPSASRVLTDVTINKVLPFAVIEKDDSILDALDTLLKEYGLARYMEGLQTVVVEPYSEDNTRPVTAYEYSDFLVNPTIKVSPRIADKKAVVTLSKVVEKDNQTVFQLYEDGDVPSSDDAINPDAYYPEDGELEASYETDYEADSDTIELAYTTGRTYEYTSTAVGDEESSADNLLVEVAELGATEATFRFKNQRNVNVYLNQLTIKAEKVYYRDTSTVISDSSLKGRIEEDEIESVYMVDTDDVQDFIKSYRAELFAEKTTYSLKTGKIEAIEPNTLITVGDIPTVILVRYIEQDLSTGELTVEGVQYSVVPISTTSVVKKNSATGGISYLSLTLDGTSYTYDGDGNLSPSGQMITATVRRFGTVETPRWYINGALQEGEEGLTLQIPPSFMAGRSLITVRVEVGTLYSEAYIYKLTDGKNGQDGKDGQDGADAKLLSLSTDNNVFRLKADGTPYDNQKAVVTVNKQGISEDTTFVASNGMPIADNTEEITVTPYSAVMAKAKLNNIASNNKTRQGNLVDGISYYYSPAFSNGRTVDEDGNIICTKVSSTSSYINTLLGISFTPEKYVEVSKYGLIFIYDISNFESNATTTIRVSTHLTFNYIDSEGVQKNDYRIYCKENNLYTIEDGGRIINYMPPSLLNTRPENFSSFVNNPTYKFHLVSNTSSDILSVSCTISNIEVIIPSVNLEDAFPYFASLSDSAKIEVLETLPYFEGEFTLGGTLVNKKDSVPSQIYNVTSLGEGSYQREESSVGNAFSRIGKTNLKYAIFSKANITENETGIIFTNDGSIQSALESGQIGEISCYRYRSDGIAFGNYLYWGSTKIQDKNAPSGVITIDEDTWTIVSLTESGWHTLLLLMGYDTDEAIYAWCKENIPSFTGEMDFPSYDTLQITAQAGSYSDAVTIGSVRDGASADKVLYQYQWGASKTEPPLALELWFWEDGFIMSWGSEIVGEDVDAGWSATYPEPVEGKPYLWQRISSDGQKSWVYSMVSGADAVGFTISASPVSFTMSSRSYVKEAQTIELTAKLMNVDDDIIPVWSVSDGSITLSATSGENVTATVPAGYTASSFTVTCTVGDLPTQTLKISGVLEGEPKAMKLDTVKYPDSFPTSTSEGPLLFGDHLLYIDQNGYQTPYYWTGSAWAQTTEQTQNYAQIMWDILPDALTSEGTVPSTSALYAFFGYLASKAAFIEQLYAVNLIAGNVTDADPNVGFRFRAIAKGEDGKPVFDVTYNGKTIFKIVPDTGRIFFGEPNTTLDAPASGFMYDPADQSIRSVDDKVVIMSDGSLNATDCNIDGTAIIRSGVVSCSLDCPSFSSLPAESPGTSVTINVNTTGAQSQYQTIDTALSDFAKSTYRCTHSLDTDIKYIEKTSINGYTGFYFYDSNFIVAGRIYRLSSGYSSTWATKTFTTVVYDKTGDVFKFKDIPVSADNLETGQVYVEEGFLKIKG